MIRLLFALLLVPLVCISSDDIITFAGDGSAGFAGEGTAASTAILNNPTSLATDATGNLYIADTANNRVRKIDVATSLITTIAGTGTAAFSGDGAAATAAALNAPTGVAINAAGDIFISDTGNNRIRKVSGGTINTYAGDGTAAFGGEGGPATSASLNAPSGLTLNGNTLILCDTGNHRVRSIDGFTQAITTIAGNGTAAFAGDNAPASAASLNGRSGVRVAPSGDVFIADTGNNRVRKINMIQDIETVVGNGTAGFAGDGGLAGQAQISGPVGLELDASDNVYIADAGNNRLRKVDNATQTISTTAGSGTAGFSGDGADSTLAALNSPKGIVVISGFPVIADSANNRLRRLQAVNTPKPSLVTAAAAMPSPASTSVAVSFTVDATPPTGKTLTYSWNFGDGSARASGQTVTHTYAAAGDFTFAVLISDGSQSLSSSGTISVLGPNAGAENVKNVSENIQVTNPITQTSSAVTSSNGGVLDFAFSQAGSQSRAGEDVSTDFKGADGIATRTAKGSKVSNKFTQPGVSVVETSVREAGTGTLRGKVRKTIAVSRREAGMAPSNLIPASTRSFLEPKLTGKFLFTKTTSDQVTFAGKFAMPGGFDLREDHEASIGIGNVTDTVSVVSKGKPAGKGTPVSGRPITKMAIKYPKVDKANPVTSKDQVATISFTMKIPDLDTMGFDTEGISRDGTSGNLNIQVLLMLDGESYELLAPVEFKKSTKGDAGSMKGRQAN